jgi:hypothetical protein
MQKPKRKALNIPSNKDPFEDVSFVNDMSPAKMRTFIKDIWGNLQALAALLDKSRPDIAGVLDRIMDGLTWDEKEVDGRYWFGNYKGFNIRWDNLTKQFTLMDTEHNAIEEPIPAISGDTILNKKRK